MRKRHGPNSAAGVVPIVRVDGKVNANVYQNIPQQHVVLPLRASPNQPANFMQDNAPSHTAERFEKFLDDKGIEILKWPVQSKNLNPIENLWKIIVEKVVAKNHPLLLNYETNLRKNTTTSLHNCVTNWWRHVDDDVAKSFKARAYIFPNNQR